MNPAQMPGYGDAESFPPHVRARDPQRDDDASRIDAAEAWAVAQAIRASGASSREAARLVLVDDVAQAPRDHHSLRRDLDDARIE